MTTLAVLDHALAQRYGDFASYTNDFSPALVETYGDSPANEVDRLLDHLASPESRILDLGCGAGFTLCRLAPQVAEIWGFEQEPDLLAAARQRAADARLDNTVLVQGNVALDEDLAPLPDTHFDILLSRRGPNVTAALLPKLKAEAYVIQELFQDSPGLLESFGRKTFVADIVPTPHWLVDEYTWLGLFPISMKEYYFDSFFRDAEHLASYLSQEKALFSWPMPPMPYEAARDQAALALYARYNTTPKGIRVVNHRKVYLFRRMTVHYAPAAPDIKPL
jgi:SAM-dependent methyltransferase